MISTGSQGEPMSALALMAGGENQWLKIGERRHGDPVSSHAIPGNEFNVDARSSTAWCGSAPRSCTPASADVHATGHARQDELKTLLSIARPEWFMPVHGEFRHLVAHAGCAD